MSETTDTEIENQQESEGSGLPPSQPPSEEERLAPPPSPTAPPNGAGTLSGNELIDLDERAGDVPAERSEATGPVAVQKAANGSKMTDREQQAALDWLLQAEPDAGEVETKVLELNFGTSDKPDMKLWEIQPVGLDEMRRIRSKYRNTRQARKTGEIDETRMNLAVVVAGTKSPDVALAARLAAEQGNGTGDATEIVRARFQSKPGYLAQVSAEIMQLSGFDEDDVTEREMVSAAGN